MAREDMADEKLKTTKEYALMELLAKVFMNNTDETILNNALDDFSDVFGKEIPWWFQCLHNFFDGRDKYELQMRVIRQYAENHNLDIGNTDK